MKITKSDLAVLAMCVLYCLFCKELTQHPEGWVVQGTRVLIASAPPIVGALCTALFFLFPGLVGFYLLGTKKKK